TASGPESMRVVRTSPSGVATLVLKVGPFAANASGQQQTTPAQTITLKIAPDGKVVGGGLLGGITQSFGASLPGTNQFAPLLPDRNVSPGDRWDTSVKRSLSALGSGSLAFTAHSTYERNE